MLPTKSIQTSTKSTGVNWTAEFRLHCSHGIWNSLLPVLRENSLSLNAFMQILTSDEPARRSASRHTCCKQSWTLSVINLRRPNCKLITLATVDVSSYSELFVENCQLQPTPPAFGISFRVTPFEFCRDRRLEKTRVPGLSCGVICVTLRLAISVEHRLVTDRHMTIAYTAPA